MSLERNKNEHTFHLQVKLSQMDLQCPFYKAHVLEEGITVTMTEKQHKVATFP